MKKIILSAAILAAVNFSATAQEAMKFGVKAGVNFATFGGDANNAESRTGFHAGAVAEFKLSENFSIQPELLYSQMGSKTNESVNEFGVNFREEVSNKYDYISLPILAKYYIIKGLSIEAGPQIGFLVSAKGELDRTVNGESISTSADVKDSTKSIDFGLAGGLAYDLPVGLFFQARYYAGISNIADEEGSDNGDSDFEVKNMAIQLSIGYKF
jgi:opacity protein-like surface antigen